MSKIHYEHTGSNILHSREAFDRRPEWEKNQEAKRLRQPVAIFLQTDGYHLITVASPAVLVADDESEATR
jgi:hypothetical protein